MGVIVQLSCDRQIPYGVCPAQSWHAGGVEAAVTRARELGWYYRPARNGEPEHALCPEHAGSVRDGRSKGTR
ncbi:hypothetical protein [Actinophytocola sp.]|uniref:hypothetical protein n=1 Tax=Actinophytocola sp. TaxID=1872138 RepID=UPI002D73932F|nr:hypothetical protein [Actinophytocola sp.]HYQ69049.1 hypothetical protein [Actinophytocola sp.]